MKRVIPDTITEEEFVPIIKSVKNLKKRLAYMLGFYQGMRVSEVINLRPENIDLGRKLIMIKQAKGSKDRHIPIAPEVLRGLKHLPIGGTVRALQISWNRISEKSKGHKLNFHLLRHSSATHYLNVKKWDVRYVQQFLGHANLNTTQLYTHVSPQNLIAKMWEEKHK